MERLLEELKERIDREDEVKKKIAEEIEEELLNKWAEVTEDFPERFLYVQVSPLNSEHHYYLVTGMPMLHYTHYLVEPCSDMPATRLYLTACSAKELTELKKNIEKTIKKFSDQIEKDLLTL